MPVIRYEDLSERPTESFRKIASALGLGGKAAAIDRAIAAADFKALQAAEASGGFAESSDKTERFFRSGKVGGWRDQLSEQQQSRLAELDGELMKRFKYR